MVGGITDSVDMGLSKLWEIEEREAWSAAVHGVTELDTIEWPNNNEQQEMETFKENPADTAVNPHDCVHALGCSLWGATCVVHSRSVKSNPLQPFGPARLFCPRDSPCKNTGGSFLLQGIFPT